MKYKLVLSELAEDLISLTTSSTAFLTDVSSMLYQNLFQKPIIYFFNRLSYLLIILKETI